MNYFLAKTEPSTYSIHDLESEVVTLWDGVHNHEAINVIKSMCIGDIVYIYHSMTDKKIVGIAEVVSEPLLNIEDPRPSWATKFRFIRRVDGPRFAEIKAEPSLSKFKLVTHSRLSVMPVPAVAVDWIEARI